MDKSNREAAELHSDLDNDGGSSDAYTFRFVEVGNPSQGRDEEARAVIRSHVMRDFYERRDTVSRPLDKPELSSAASKKEGVAQQTHRFRVGPEGLREVKKRRTKHKVQKKGALSSETKTARGCPSEKNGNRSSRFDLATRSPLGKPNSYIPTYKYGKFSPRDSVSHEASLLTASASTNRNMLPQPEYLPPDAGLIDPFNTLPIINSPRAQVLLYHANRGILSSRIMGQLRTEWLSLATQDAAFFYVALSHYAGNYSLMSKEKDPMEALRFRMESMKIINNRLEDVNTALIDGTIGTVASLSSYEATNGSLTGIRTHMKGLQKLVELRGGLDDPNMSPYTRRLVLWADLNCANALGTNAIFPLLDPSDISPPEATFHHKIQDYRNLASETINADHTNPKRDPEALRKELRENFTNLKHIMKIVNEDDAKYRSGKIWQIQNSDKLYFTERSLQRLSNRWGPRKFVSSGCISAIIFVDNYLRGIPFNARMMDRLVARLHYSMKFVLEELSQHDGNAKASYALFWVLFVGGVASRERTEGEWFLTHLTDFSRWLSIKSWNDAEQVLKGFLWPYTWDRLGHVLWTEIENNHQANMMSWLETAQLGDIAIDHLF